MIEKNENKQKTFFTKRAAKPLPLGVGIQGTPCSPVLALDSKYHAVKQIKGQTSRILKQEYGWLRLDILCLLIYN